jgi:hypothetical protein
LAKARRRRSIRRGREAAMNDACDWLFY